MTTINHKNPWIGWSSYDEDSINHGHLFVGRTNEISQLFSLIDNNLLVTVYGKSGIGKTSLLKAGVFPSLVASSYVPVICRCGSDDKDNANDKEKPSDKSLDKENTASDKKYITAIIDEIRKKCSIIPKTDEVDISKITDLIQLFQQCSFKNEDNEVFPVLVFDQFEDLARLEGKPAIPLLRDIAFLVSNDYPHTTNFRFVLSIREDYLYLIEDIIDSIAYSDLKQNRYRLTHLNRDQAKEIFNLGTLTNNVQEKLLEITKDNTAGYTPGLISFFCHELYEASNGNITDECLGRLKDGTSLIGDFYNKCFKSSSSFLGDPREETKISLATKAYIEEYLQENGVRRPQKLSQVEKSVPPKELESLLEGSNKLLQKFPVGDEEYVELIHDKIAEIIYQEKKRRLEEETKLEEAKREAQLEVKKRALSRVLLLCYIIAAFFVWKRLYDIRNIIEALPSCQYDDTEMLIIKLVAAILSIFFIIFMIPFNICGCVYNSKKLKYLIISIVIAGASYML